MLKKQSFAQFETQTYNWQEVNQGHLLSRSPPKRAEAQTPMGLRNPDIYYN